VEPDTLGPRPEEHCLAGELWAVVADEHHGQRSTGSQLIEGTGYALTGDPPLSG
jgi:hypothetical protein